MARWSGRLVIWSGQGEVEASLQGVSARRSVQMLSRTLRVLDCQRFLLITQRSQRKNRGKRLDWSQKNDIFIMYHVVIHI